jgi:predicted AAA+ superfamily ATPase
MSISRTIYKDIKKYAAKYPIIAITGPRQAGKTTLMQEEFKKYRYVSLENPDHMEFAINDPNGFLKQYNKYVIFDEVQRVPSLFSYLQSVVDRDKIMGQYILSGSQSFNLIENITQSLAGRVCLFRLFPFDIQELSTNNMAMKSIGSQLFKGFYPAIYDRKINPAKYYSDYIETYVKRDISQLVNIQDMRSFNRFVKLCAVRAGYLLNYSDLAKDAGISHMTARNWMSLLETSFITFLLPPYYKNYNKRLTKSPKLYFYDTGLLCHLLRVDEKKLSSTHALWGHLFENYVVAEYHKLAAHQNLYRDMYFWRDSHGHEVDLLIEENDHLQIVEIKASSTVKSDMFKEMDRFQSLDPDNPIKKTLVYGGTEAQKRSNYNVVPWNQLGVGKW